MLILLAKLGVEMAGLEKPESDGNPVAVIKIPAPIVWHPVARYNDIHQHSAVS